VAGQRAVRFAGRLLFGALLVALGLVLVLLLRAGIAGAGLTSPSAAPAYDEIKPSLVYALRSKPTRFVFSRPQERVRILTNAELPVGATEKSYGFLVEALDGRGSIIWRREIHVRSVALFVRDERGRLMPHVFMAQQGALQPSAADATMIDFDRPVSAIRFSARGTNPGVARILVRVQEQRPLSSRQVEVGWQRLSEVEQAQLTAGNPIGPAPTSEAERQRLLINGWNPVGPAGVQGRDYVQTVLYERPGATLVAPTAS
jgi:hypothetical protein